MGESRNNGIFEKELEEKLKWYTRHASEEEIDEKAVESILYLLDHTAPLQENISHTPEDAWKRFQEIVEKQQELLPMPKDKLPRKPYASGEEPEDKKTDDRKPDDKETGNWKSGRGKARKFVTNHKIFAAAALLLLILAVSGTIRVGANAVRNNGFFFWMKRDDTGIQAMLSPEDLNAETDNVKRQIYQNREDLPDWAQEWIEIEAGFEMPDNYEWQYFETNIFAKRWQITSHYFNKDTKEEIISGVWIYLNKAYYSEDFTEYSFLQSYEVYQKQMDIYNRVEETGEIFYMICFYENNSRYFIRGEGNLEELKDLAEKYYICVENNL